MVACGLCRAERWRVFYPWYFDDARIGLVAGAHGEGCPACGGHGVIGQRHRFGIPVGLGGVAVAVDFGKNRGAAGVYRSGRGGIASGAKQACACVGVAGGDVGIYLYYRGGCE